MLKAIIWHRVRQHAPNIYARTLYNKIYSSALMLQCETCLTNAQFR